MMLRILLARLAAWRALHLITRGEWWLGVSLRLGRGRRR
jgi:hypothetical protein